MKQPRAQSRFIGGIADYTKEGAEATYAFGRCIDYRTDPRRITLLPKTTKESGGSTILALPKWGERVGSNTYIYDEGGNIYKRTNAASYSTLRTVANSHGNGLTYFGEDDYLYYITDKTVGRYGPVSGTPTFVDDFLTAEGGVPLNTYSLDLESGSSQYASVADNAAQSITGDLCIEAFFRPESLPAVGSSMTLVSKWLENGNKRSYMLDIYAVSGYFGDGSDGALTISSDTTEAPIDSAATATSGSHSISATNASFAASQIILLHQSRGTGAGTWQRTKIVSYTAGTITTEDSINANYVSGAQVRVLPQYTNVTINSGINYTAKAWTGSVGGILAFLASGTVTVTGTITAATKGFAGGAATFSANSIGLQGEGTAGASGTRSTSANGNGAGGGGVNLAASGNQGAGGGGGNGSAGSTGATGTRSGSQGGTGGSAAGSADLTTMVFGGGGGSGGHGANNGTDSGGAGGNGGGIIFLSVVTLTITGSIVAGGGGGLNGAGDGGAGGGGGGGSILLKAQTATLGSSLVAIVATQGGTGGSGSGGSGGNGRVHLDYYTSYTGTTTPTLDVTQDNTLVTNTTYQARLSLSSTGTNVERLTKNIDIATGTFYRFSVSWDASASTATFYLNAVSVGTATGAFTSLNDNDSSFAVGCYFDGASAAASFADGLIDDVRLWNTERTAQQIYDNNERELVGTEAGLASYYQLDNAYTDSTAAGNTLTATGSPVFSTTVPFASPTTRLDLDQYLDTSGQVYALTTAINEGATHRQTFVPSKDPQKSIQVNVSAKGSSADWTLTVHDGLNRTIASKTLTNAELSTGDVEFTFSSVWRPVIGASYHFHLTATNTTGAPAVVTTTVSDLETADFHSYYQFLVEDDDFHPACRFLNKIVIGNERYLATWDASSYDPHQLTLPSGYRIRALAYWREYLAIGVWRGTSITDYDEGYIFFWDGTSDTYNFYVSVPEGGINAMFGSRGKLHVFAGYQGDHLIYQGGDEAIKVKRIPKITKDKYVEIFPGAVTMWQALMRYGVSGNTDSASIEKGVYTYGSLNISAPDSLSYDYPISTGNRTASNIRVGMVLPVENKLLIGWQDNIAFGVDVVDPAGSPFSSGTLELLIKDNGAVYKEKKIDTLRADFEPLNSGESIKLKYKINRADDWTEGASDNETGLADDADDTRARLPISSGRHHELQVAVDLATSVSTSPALLEVSIEDDKLEEEEEF